MVMTEFVANSEEAVGDSHYFYDQLDENAQKIYDALFEMFSKGLMTDGKSGYDLVEHGAVTEEALANYIGGDRSLADAFAAAKDAFDLDHSEAWYVDSSYLSLRVARTQEGTYTAIVGIEWNKKEKLVERGLQKREKKTNFYR